MEKSDNDRWEKVRDVWNIIERLRGESGCPWDRKQTPETVQTYLVEEAHEGAAAVRSGKVEEVAEELGDVLFMVLFLVYLYEQRGDFSLDEVCARVTEKMIRRHPHVFGDISVETADEVKDNWEKIKADEKKTSGKAAEPVPHSLPALMRAYRIISRLAHLGNGEWNDPDLHARNFSRRSREIVDALSTGAAVSDESVGEILFEIVTIARIKGYRAEDCLHRMLPRIERG